MYCGGPNNMLFIAGQMHCSWGICPAGETLDEADMSVQHCHLQVIIFEINDFIGIWPPSGALQECRSSVHAHFYVSDFN